MKILKTFVASLAIFLLFFVVFNKNIRGQDCEGLSTQECVQKYTEKKAAETEKGNSLATEIEYMDTQINLTALRIRQTEEQILNTQNEIETLGNRIEGVNDSLDYLTKLLFNKIREGYKRRDIPIFSILLDSDSANTLVNQLKYAQIAQENDRRVSFQLQQAKTNFENQKDLREQKVAELDTLEAQLKSQKNALGNQRSEKKAILQITKNNEALYQRIIQQVLAEARAVQGAVLSSTKIGPVKKGDPIALVGNSGAPYCSTGAHLHYEVHSNSSWNSWIDPSPYLSGEWQHPLQDPVIVTQNFGQTPWSSRYNYSGGIHTGIDMYSNSSDVIRAPADGELYASSQLCGSSVLNVKRIVHPNGIETFFLHVQ